MTYLIVNQMFRFVLNSGRLEWGNEPEFRNFSFAPPFLKTLPSRLLSHVVQLPPLQTDMACRSDRYRQRFIDKLSHRRHLSRWWIFILENYYPEGECHASCVFEQTFFPCSCPFHSLLLTQSSQRTETRKSLASENSLNSFRELFSMSWTGCQ